MNYCVNFRRIQSDVQFCLWEVKAMCFHSLAEIISLNSIDGKQVKIR